MYNILKMIKTQQIFSRTTIAYDYFSSFFLVSNLQRIALLASCSMQPLTLNDAQPASKHQHDLWLLFGGQCVLNELSLLFEGAIQLHWQALTLALHHYGLATGACTILELGATI
jgi:hypothetical protein